LLEDFIIKILHKNEVFVIVTNMYIYLHLHVSERHNVIYEVEK